MKTRKELRDERIKLARDLKEKGLTFEEIGKQLGITRQRASAIFLSDAHAPSITKWSKLYPTFIEEYTVNDLPMNKIAEKYKCPIGIIQICFKKNGIKANKRRGRKPSSEVTT
jgi:predicted transcriptional regulator